MIFNADKTEILALNTNNILEHELNYDGMDLRVKTVMELKYVVYGTVITLKANIEKI